MRDVIVLKGAIAICRAVGKDRRDIVRLVRDENLPAWQEQGKGTWFALPEDLKAWVEKRARLYLEERPGTEE
jgi:hypothetical protein